MSHEHRDHFALNETNDYSIDATKTAFADWDKIVLFVFGRAGVGKRCPQ